MATSMSISRAPRALSEIVSDLGIDNARKPASKDAELRADSKSLRVKTGTAWIFKSANARTDHRTQARTALLDGLRVSLQRSYTDAQGFELGAAVMLAADHLKIPDRGTAVKVEHLRKLSVYADQISRIKQECRLPLPVAHDVVAFFEEGRNGNKTEPAELFSDQNMIAVGTYLKSHPRTSVEVAFKEVTKRRDAKAASAQTAAGEPPMPQAPLKAKAQAQATTHIRKVVNPEDFMSRENLQRLKPEKRWQLLNVASHCVPDYFKDEAGLAWIDTAARAMVADSALKVDEALARYVTRAEKIRIHAFAGGEAFLSAMSEDR